MYPVENPFPYASGYYAIFPRNFKRDIGDGSIVVADDYLIYFKPGTPEEIKTRLVKDYAEYHKKNIEQGIIN